MKNWVAQLLVVILAAVGVAFFLWPAQVKILPTFIGLPAIPSDPQEQMKDVIGAGLSGDYEGLVDLAQNVQAGAGNQAAYNRAREYEAYGKFKLGTLDGRLEAVRIATEQYEKNPGNSAVQATSMNQIIEFVTSARIPEVLDAIAKSSAFSKHWIPGDFYGSVGSLAKESYGLQPSVIAAAYMILPDAVKALEGRSMQDAGKKKALAKAVADKMPFLEEGFKAEQIRTGGSPGEIVVPFLYYYWKGYLYGAASYSDKQYFPEVLKSLEAYTDYYEATRGTDGKPIPVLEGLYPKQKIYYMQTVVEVGGTEYRELVNTHTQDVIEIVTSNLELHEKGYIGYLRNLAAGNSVTLSGNVRTLQVVGDAYPPFKDFVRQYGVVLK